jgi:hypothetical protein
LRIEVKTIFFPSRVIVASASYRGVVVSRFAPLPSRFAV